MKLLDPKITIQNVEGGLLTVRIEHTVHEL